MPPSCTAGCWPQKHIPLTAWNRHESFIVDEHHFFSCTPMDTQPFVCTARRSIRAFAPSPSHGLVPLRPRNDNHVCSAC